RDERGFARGLLDLFFLWLVGRDPERAEEALVVRADLEGTFDRPGRLLGPANLRESGRVGPVHEPDDGLEADLHLEPGGAGPLTGSFNPGIIGNGGTNGVG